MTMLRHIDLCAGTGAFSLVLQKTGKVKTVYANDILASSKKIYMQNFTDSSHFVLGDIMDVEPSTIPAFDILTGGFPCQPFSLAGKKLGFEDDRSNVFWKIIDIVKEHAPKMVVLENVKNLVSHDKGKTLETVLKALTDCNYTVSHKVIDTHTFTGIPQHRERIYIVCIRNDLRITYEFPENVAEELYKPLSDFYVEEPKKSLYYTDKLKVWDRVMDAVVKENVVYQYRRHYVRENMSGIVPTLTANMGHGGHNVPLIKDKKGIRKLSTRECFSLQGFPSDYMLEGLSDSQLYALAGNSVTLDVVKRIFDGIIDKIYQ